VAIPDCIFVVEVEGDDSAPQKVFTNDIYPPGVPTGLQAVISGPGQAPFVDLLWAPDTDADLAGYNIYRREEGTQPAKLNEGLVKTPAYRDSNVTPGQTYWYSISAVDLRGNESARSDEASETVSQN
jgi:fibronectin type 3 domain-containing protein